MHPPSTVAEVADRGKRRPGEGSVSYEAARGRWRAMLSWRDDEGRLHRATKSAPSRSEAEMELAKLRLACPAPADGEEVAFGAWLDHWLATVLPGLRVSERTKADYERHARALAPLAATPLCSLGVRDVEALLADLAAKGYSRTTCRLVRATLSRVLGDAERTDLVTRNVAHAARLPADAAAPKERRTLSHEEAALLEQALSGERDEALWLSMLLLGLRPGEAAALAWGDVDLEAGVLHVVQARRWTPRGYEVGATKTRRSARVVRMPPRLAAAFCALERGGAPDDALVFPSRSGRLLEPSSMNQRLARLCARAGVDRVTSYELRHSAASLLSDAGVPIETLADLLGHTSTQMLEAVYRHRVRKVVDPGIW